MNVELSDQDKNNLKTEIYYINEAITSNFKKINDLMQQAKEILNRNEILLRENTYLGINVSMDSNFQKMKGLMLQVKELILQNDKILWAYIFFEPHFLS